MNLEPYIAVSGLPGIYEMVSNRPNGLIVSEIDSDKSIFCSVRKHQFTPLGTVAIYTLEDTTPLNEVFKTMLEQLVDNPPPGNKATKEDFFEYFDNILPDYDEDRVFINDIKKIVKWFNFLNEKGVLNISDEEE